MSKPARTHTNTMSRRSPDASFHDRHLLSDVVTLIRLALTPRARLAAENLFLREQTTPWAADLARVVGGRTAATTGTLRFVVGDLRDPTLCQGRQCFAAAW